MGTPNPTEHAARVSRIVDRLTLATDEADNSGRSYIRRRQAVARLRLEIEELRDLARTLADADDGVPPDAEDLNPSP